MVKKTMSTNIRSGILDPAEEFTLAYFKGLGTGFQMARSRRPLGVRSWDLRSEQGKVSSFFGPTTGVVLPRDSDTWL